MNSQEAWEGIPGFDERFEVSSKGRVRRVYESGGVALISQSNNNNARRLTVSLLPNGSSKRVRRTVAKLVCLAFNGVPDTELSPACVLHLNGVLDDNRPENLKWVSMSEANLKGRERNGK